MVQAEDRQDTRLGIRVKPVEWKGEASQTAILVWSQDTGKEGANILCHNGW